MFGRDYTLGNPERGIFEVQSTSKRMLTIKGQRKDTEADDFRCYNARVPAFRRSLWFSTVRAAISNRLTPNKCGRASYTESLR
jgi:hypothetical protein